MKKTALLGNFFAGFFLLLALFCFPKNFYAENKTGDVPISGEVIGNPSETGENSSPAAVQENTAAAGPAEEVPAVEEPVSPQSLSASDNVSLDFKDADIRNVLRIISFKAGVNIVPTPEVMGNVTIRLQDVPWEKALDTVVKTYGYGYEWLNNKVIMVSTLEKLASQRKAEEEAAANEPMATEYFVLSFTKAEDVKTSLEKMLSEKGKISVETRSNTLIITDTKSKLAKLGQIIKELDRVTPQVMIEAKIIETSLGNAEKLGIDWTIRAALSGSKRPTTFPFQTEEYAGDGKKMFPEVQAPDQLETVDTVTTDPTSGIVTHSKSQILLNKLIRGFPAVSDEAFVFGTLDFSQFQMVLEVLNQRTDTKILSNPKITTLNNQEAKILVGTIVPIPNYEYSKDTGTRVVSGYTDQEIGVGLTVTPNVNEQKYITLNVKPTIDEITGFTGPNNERPIIATRNAETNVMVKDGQTLVIGGLISEKKIKFKKKVPLLGDIPGIGALLFTKKEDTVDRTELLIFITLHIVNEKDFSSAQGLAELHQASMDTIDKLSDNKKRKPEL